MDNKGKHCVLVIPDLHIPFEHQDAFAFLKWVKKKYPPNVVVNVGDEVDMHALSDYDHDPDGYSAGDELKASIDKLKELYEIFPKTLVCTSNHTARPFRRAFKHGIPRAFLRDYREFLEAPVGWTWKSQWEIDSVQYEHGEGQSGAMGALKAALANAKCTTIGHIHSNAGILYSANERDLIWGFNVGSLIDRHKYAFAYGRVLKSKPILGCGVVIKGVPTYLPMLLNRAGRWIGR